MRRSTGVIGATLLALGGLSGPMAPAASAADGPIEMKEYNDEGKYHFRYPAVCEVRWESSQEIMGRIYFKCAPGHGFASFSVKYGAGNAARTIDEVFEEHLPADGAEQVMLVDYTPHQVGTDGDAWSNFVIFPEVAS